MLSEVENQVVKPGLAGKVDFGSSAALLLGPIFIHTKQAYEPGNLGPVALHATNSGQ